MPSRRILVRRRISSGLTPKALHRKGKTRPRPRDRSNRSRNRTNNPSLFAFPIFSMFLADDRKPPVVFSGANGKLAHEFLPFMSTRQSDNDTNIQGIQS